jgi:hypothetical protein
MGRIDYYHIKQKCSNCKVKDEAGSFFAAGFADPDAVAINLQVFGLCKSCQDLLLKEVHETIKEFQTPTEKPDSRVSELENLLRFIRKPQEPGTYCNNCCSFDCDCHLAKLQKMADEMLTLPKSGRSLPVPTVPLPDPPLITKDMIGSFLPSCTYKEKGLDGVTVCKCKTSKYYNKPCSKRCSDPFIIQNDDF